MPLYLFYWKETVTSLNILILMTNFEVYLITMGCIFPSSAMICLLMLYRVLWKHLLITHGITFILWLCNLSCVFLFLCQMFGSWKYLHLTVFSLADLTYLPLWITQRFTSIGPPNSLLSSILLMINWLNIEHWTEMIYLLNLIECIILLYL